MVVLLITKPLPGKGFVSVVPVGIFANLFIEDLKKMVDVFWLFEYYDGENRLIQKVEKLNERI